MKIVRMENIREILAFSGWNGTGVPEHFIRDFYQWELIHQLGHQVSNGPEIENGDLLCLCEDNLKGEQR